jgi:hypothetical protein
MVSPDGILGCPLKTPEIGPDQFFFCRQEILGAVFAKDLWIWGVVDNRKSSRSVPDGGVVSSDERKRRGIFSQVREAS